MTLIRTIVLRYVHGLSHGNATSIRINVVHYGTQVVSALCQITLILCPDKLFENTVDSDQLASDKAI